MWVFACIIAYATHTQQRHVAMFLSRAYIFIRVHPSSERNLRSITRGLCQLGRDHTDTVNQPKLAHFLQEISGESAIVRWVKNVGWLRCGCVACAPTVLIGFIILYSLHLAQRQVTRVRIHVSISAFYVDCADVIVCPLSVTPCCRWSQTLHACIHSCIHYLHTYIYIYIYIYKCIHEYMHTHSCMCMLQMIPNTAP